jgi:hypothetical protein
VITCPSCGAGNAASASWCGQCFAVFAQESDSGADGPGTGARLPAGTTDRSPPEEAPSTPSAPSGIREPGEAVAAGLRQGPEGLEWSCVACEVYNPLEASTCVVCGTPFTARFTEREAAEPVDWDAALRRNLLLPGLGHMAAGHSGSGVARMLLFGVWLLGGLLVLLGAGAAGFVVAAPLLGGAATVYVATVVDIRRLESGLGELLVGRALLWLVVAVTALLVVSTVLATAGGAPTGMAAL